MTAVSVQKIWDRAPHCAFTDLARFKGRWFCVFRESEAHAGSPGHVRVIESADGKRWKSAARIDEPDVDLRDPKLSVTPGRRLMLLMGGTAREGRRPRVTFSDDGRLWTPPRQILGEGDWLWRVTWFQSQAYGVSYRVHGPRRWSVALYKSSDGIEYRRICRLAVPGRPNETTVRFLPSGKGIALVRREGGDGAAWIGQSRPPYSKWKWRSAGMRVGGPNFLVGPGNLMWAACRHYAGGPSAESTVISRMDSTALLPSLTLPSGGDCGYPGMASYHGLLWVSYYSSHEGKASIYLAKVRQA